MLLHNRRVVNAQFDFNGLGYKPIHAFFVVAYWADTGRALSKLDLEQLTAENYDTLYTMVLGQPDEQFEYISN